MKYIIIKLFMLLGVNLFSQSEQYVGNYEDKTKPESEIIVEYKLSLNLDGTFLFHFYQNQICYIDDLKAKGKWTTVNNVIIFYVANEVDIDETRMLYFDKTKAKVKNGFLEFFDCKTSWLNKLVLKKKE